MPSDTFFRLPPQKRETLLACAREEFARVSYPEASINRIIHNAHIPRGSFYMYFTDKADLFFYLMDRFADRLAGQLGQLLDQEKGDLFATVLALFDRVQATCRRGGGEGGWGYLWQILRLNGRFTLDTLPRQALCGRFKALLGQVDTSGLDLREDRDLEEMLHILMDVTAPAVMRSALLDDPAGERERLVHILGILRRGMARPHGCGQQTE